MTKRERVDGKPTQPFVVSWLRPKFGKQEFSLQDDKNWALVRDWLSPPGTGRPIFLDQLSFTIRKQPRDLEHAIEMAQGEIDAALEDTAGDRKTADGRWSERQDKRADNKLNGGWGRGRD